ncbi:MAG: hypothetical protein WC582_04610 [Patescibacteria group bacterium]
MLGEGKFKNKYRISSPRLKGYDYAQAGYYFITICAKGRICWFGEIKNGEMAKSEIGEIAEKCWLEIPSHFPFVRLEEFIIMPNHIHGIIVIDDDCRDAKSCVSTFNPTNVGDAKSCVSTMWTKYKNKFGPQSRNLSSIIRGFKIGVKNFSNQSKIDFLWQNRFYDHIVRNENELNKIRQYIVDNPLKWELDRNNPENLLM